VQQLFVSVAFLSLPVHTSSVLHSSPKYSEQVFMFSVIQHVLDSDEQK